MQLLMVILFKVLRKISKPGFDIESIYKKFSSCVRYRTWKVMIWSTLKMGKFSQFLPKFAILNPHEIFRMS